jgi:hypothetical protein
MEMDIFLENFTITVISVEHFFQILKNKLDILSTMSCVGAFLSSITEAFKELFIFLML